MEKRFEPPYIRDRRVILEDIYECERILRQDMSERDRKEFLKFREELDVELSHAKPSLIERVLRRLK